MWKRKHLVNKTFSPWMQISRSRGHEGVMAKERASVYSAGARGQSWLKIKQARTLDLVIPGAEWGGGLVE
jgi:ATP-dependent DNA ligase